MIRKETKNNISSIGLTAATQGGTSTLRRPSRSSRKDATNKTFVVSHDYKDHYFDPAYNPDKELEEVPHDSEDAAASRRRRGPRGGVATPFTKRLYSMLSQAEAEGFEHIVSWQPHGRSFLIHNPKSFVDTVMPKYFQQTKLTSFQRQVNLYGFRRLTSGRDRGAYYNPLFLRGRPDLAQKIRRMRIKGTGCKPASNARSEPDFYTRFHPCFENNPHTEDNAHHHHGSMAKRSDSISTAISTVSGSSSSNSASASRETLPFLDETTASPSPPEKLGAFVKLAPSKEDDLTDLHSPKYFSSMKDDHVQQHLLSALKQSTYADFPVFSQQRNQQSKVFCRSVEHSIHFRPEQDHRIPFSFHNEPTHQQQHQEQEQQTQLQERPHADFLLNIQDDIISLFADDIKHEDMIASDGQSDYAQLNMIDPLYFLSDEGQHHTY